MKGKCSVFVVCLFTLVAGSAQYSRGQLDTVGIPLDIGNRWYYSYTSRTTPSPIVLVKTISDTAAGGLHLVRLTRLGNDSVTLRTETWIVTNGSFYDSVYVNPVCLYNASLSQDTSWYYVQYGVYQGSIHLDRVTILGSDSRCQIRSTYTIFTQGGEGWTDTRVALGIGIYYDHSDGFAYESGWGWTYQLIGLLKDGVLYGDSSLTPPDTIPPNTVHTPKLIQNFPNPFNQFTTIGYGIFYPSQVTLTVFNTLGQRVAELVDGELVSGFYQSTFDASGLASGVYYYRLQAGNSMTTKKLIILR